MNDLAKNVLLWTVIAIVIFAVVSNFSRPPGKAEPLGYSEFLTQVETGGVAEVMFSSNSKAISGRLTNSRPFVTYSPETDNTALIGTLKRYNVKFGASEPDQPSLLWQLFLSSFPILLLVGVWVYFMRQMQGGAGGRGAMSFGKSPTWRAWRKRKKKLSRSSSF